MYSVSQFRLIGSFLLGLGLLLELSGLLLGDLLDVELVGKFLLVDLGSENQHDGDDKKSRSEDAQIVNGRAISVVDSKLEVSPSMEALEDVEQQEHANDLEPVSKVILVNGLIVPMVGSEVSTVFH